MKRLGLLVVLLSFVVFATGCPKKAADKDKGKKAGPAVTKPAVPEGDAKADADAKAKADADAKAKADADAAKAKAKDDADAAKAKADADAKKKPPT